MRDFLQLLGHVRRDGDHQFGAAERLERLRTEAVRLGFDAAEQNVGLERTLQHLRAVLAHGAQHLATGFPMRHRAGKVGPGGVAAFGQLTQRRAGQLRNTRCERAQVGVLRMAQRQRAQPHRTLRTRQQRGRSGLVRLAHGGGAAQCRQMRRHRRPGPGGNGREHRGQIGDLRGSTRLDIGGERELVVELHRVDECHPGAGEGGLAHPVGEHRHFAAQVRTDDQQTLELIHLGDAHAQVRVQRIGGLVAEITHPQPVIDVPGTKATRQAVQQVQLLGGRRRTAERSQVPAMPAQAVDGHGQRRLPAHLGPAATLADQRCADAVGAVDPLVAEAVAVGDPGFVDGLVVAGHDPHQLAAQHVAEQIGADAVMR